MSNDVLYTKQDCGCLALVVVDEPRDLIDSADEIAEQLRLGRTVHRVSLEDYRRDIPGLYCDEHKS